MLLYMPTEVIIENPCLFIYFFFLKCKNDGTMIFVDFCLFTGSSSLMKIFDVKRMILKLTQAFQKIMGKKGKLIILKLTEVFLEFTEKRKADSF